MKPLIDASSETLSLDILTALLQLDLVGLLPDRHEIVSFRQRGDGGLVLVTCAGEHHLDEGPIEIFGGTPYDGPWDAMTGDGEPLDPTQFLINGPYTQDAGGGQWRRA